ncbi:CoA-binding protein [Labilibaculum sp. A4]|uniref:CoA-binding protein n=1 Tax=Labilibaculum TaxID=2060722 RepID=UPI000F616A60|nr:MULTISPECIES: CoA-binding protein [Labilibaculum]MBN2595681.1 CoA-binding protein [Marinifilaceae bacterium]MDQ1771692.1 CoA-binding protein [Labilibaculum euxinus]MWN77319.1 CoA-binding protein [Labilibaculum euxinus]
MKNKTLIIGASLNPERYSYKAADKLLENGHDIYMIGNKAGMLFHRKIVKEQTPYTDVDTVTMYVAAKNQVSYYEYIISLHPRRVIFNPGTENTAFATQLNSRGIKTEESCTLVLLATNIY